MFNGFVVGGWNDRREDRSCPAFVCVYEKIPPKVAVGVALFQSQTTYFVFLTQKNNQDNDCLKRCPRLDDDPLNNVEINFMCCKETPRWFV